MLYILLLLIGLKLNMEPLYWILYTVWIVVRLFFYPFKQYSFIEIDIRKND